MGLLLLRLTIGFSLIIRGCSGMHAPTPTFSATVTWVAMLTGFFLLIGLWTPIAAAVLTAVEFWAGLSQTGYDWVPILLAALAASLLMLGPGAFSVDALLFGRRRVDLSEH
ncbi:MAG TPA: hypothetical protein VK466_10755 [Terriglobales bacterium]|nr:hypothetical protein [Terriglobales bacterium]